MQELTFPTMTPVQFFGLAAQINSFLWESPEDILKKEYLLPDTSALNLEESFASVYSGWSNEGIAIALRSSYLTGPTHLTDITKGDSFEVFIDTKDVKTGSFNTRFCHHFFALYEAIDGVQAGELTHFRTDDAHPLCDSSALQVQSFKSGRYQNLLFIIPKECLHGYDPVDFDRIGFTYRINRGDLPPQHFAANSRDFAIEKHPSLWSSLRLVT